MINLTQQTKEQLLQMCDADYRAFQSALLPTVSPDRILGVRVPALRRLARQMTRDGRGVQYLAAAELPHETYDESNLHAFLIEGITDYDRCIAELERFLPYIDNWATCDMMAPGVLGTQPERLYASVRQWLRSEQEYTVRYGVLILMRHFLDACSVQNTLALASAVTHDGYYVKMAVAWLTAEALAQQWNAAYPFLLSDALPPWTWRKAIQKALESRKLTDMQKAALRCLREERTWI